jgi:uncharacterized damage-inducible protein DinB
MTLDLDLTRMLEYEAWANREALASLEAAGAAAPAQAVRIMNHIVGASRLWLARLRGEKSGIAVWPSLTLEALNQEVEALHRDWREWATSRAPGWLNESVCYINTKGEPWTNSVRDILAHLLLHSPYHRGQIAVLLGASGGKAAYTDYIHAVREGLI